MLFYFLYNADMNERESKLAARELKQNFAPKLASAKSPDELQVANTEANTFIAAQIVGRLRNQPAEDIRALAHNFIEEAEKAQAQYDLDRTDSLRYEVRLYLRSANLLLTTLDDSVER